MMTKTYKFLSVKPSEIDREHGNFPIQELVPFGPEHLNESLAEDWLAEHASSDRKYILISIYNNQ